MTRLKDKFLDPNQDATKIGDGSVTTSEFQFINTLSSDAQTQLNGKAGTTLANLGTTAVNSNLTHGTAGTAWVVSTANNGAGNSGGLTIQTGTATGTRGNVTLGAQAIVLNASDMRPVSTNAVSIGVGAAFFRDMSIKEIYTYTAAGGDATWIRGITGTSPSGATIDGYIQKATNSTTPLAIFSPDKAGTSATTNILIETGNSTAGAFNSGDIKLTIGTSSGGSQGNIKFLKSGVASVSGQVWTASSTDGTGYWATSSGANTTLSNLGTTAMNADLIFNKANAILKTPNTATGTENLSIRTGDSSAVAASGNLVVQSGTGFASGSVTLKSGDITGNTNTSGALVIGSGDSSLGASGDITISTGDPDVTGYPSGALNLLTADGGQGGVITIQAGQSALAATDGPAINIIAGPAASNANGGNISLQAGTGQGTGHDGDLLVTGRRLILPNTVTGTGTTGNQTIDKMSGTVNFAAAATALTVTNDRVTADSLVFATVRTNDATAYILNVEVSTGQFVINLGAAATAETSVGFLVVNE